MEMEKAFDSIWKRGLIVKMSELGIQGNILGLIDNFLTSRKIALNVNGTKGDEREGCELWVPQGSILSPLLFNIFIMDILEDLNNKDDIVIYKFADDGTVKISADTTNMCLQTLQIVLHSVHSSGAW